MVMIFSRVIILRTSHFNTNDEFPKCTTSKPISTISPCLAALMKFISLINLVTTFEFSNCTIEYKAASSSIQANNFPPNKVPLAFKSSGFTHFLV